MAKVNRELTPAVFKEVSRAQEVFHLELSPEEMAFIFLLVGNSTGSPIVGTQTFYNTLKHSLQFDDTITDVCKLESIQDTIIVHSADIRNVLSKRQK